jgi:hypothetical protein
VDPLEGFCPRCDDYHLFRIGREQTPNGEFKAAFCMKECGFACDPSEVPHDHHEADEKYPDEA